MNWNRQKRHQQSNAKLYSLVHVVLHLNIRMHKHIHIYRIGSDRIVFCNRKPRIGSMWRRVGKVCETTINLSGSTNKRRNEEVNHQKKIQKRPSKVISIYMHSLFKLMLLGWYQSITAGRITNIAQTECYWKNYTWTNKKWFSFVLKINLLSMPWCIHSTLLLQWSLVFI